MEGGGERKEDGQERCMRIEEGERRRARGVGGRDRGVFESKRERGGGFHGLKKIFI